MRGKQDKVLNDADRSGITFLPVEENVDGHLHATGEGFGPSFSVWDQLLKTSRTRVIMASVIFVIIGVVLGATISGLVVAKKAKNYGCVAASTALDNSNISVFKEADGCDIMYKEKCFKAIVRKGMTVHLNKSKEMCSKIGWKLANIYSRSHYFMVEGYLRSNYPRLRYISVWTGMTMIPEVHQIVLSDNRNITLSGISWYTGYPSDHPKSTHMGIDVLETPNNDNFRKQGLWNFDPSWNGNGALCEK